MRHIFQRCICVHFIAGLENRPEGPNHRSSSFSDPRRFAAASTEQMGHSEVVGGAIDVQIDIL